MFHIKKDDYNSVQLIPDYKSSTSSKKRYSSRKPVSATKILLLIILIALAAIIAGGYLYWSYFSPANHFIRSLKEKDYATCTEISKENAFDSAYVTSISEPVIAMAEKAVTGYKQRTINYDEAVYQLENINTLTNDAFKEMIAEKKAELKVVEKIYNTFNNAQSGILVGKYIDGVDALIEVAKDAKEHNITLDGDISAVMNKHQNVLKAAIFNQISTLIDLQQYDRIYTYLTFGKTYLPEDADFTDYTAVADSVEAGTMEPSAAKDKAEAIADTAYPQKRSTDDSDSSDEESGDEDE